MFILKERDISTREKRKKKNEKVVQWHDAIEAVMRVELGDEAENLLFEREHQLSHKPLEMDLLIIKMQNGIQLKKNIGKIFRKHNIIEYKSPKDY